MPNESCSQMKTAAKHWRDGSFASDRLLQISRVYEYFYARTGTRPDQDNFFDDLAIRGAIPVVRKQGSDKEIEYFTILTVELALDAVLAEHTRENRHDPR